jgi:hypothetical protein
MAVAVVVAVEQTQTMVELAWAKTAVGREGSMVLVPRVRRTLEVAVAVQETLTALQASMDRVVPVGRASSLFGMRCRRYLPLTLILILTMGLLRMTIAPR